MSETSDDQNSSTEDEPLGPTNKLKQLQDTMREYNKKRRYLTKKMEEETVLWNNKLKELTKYIERVVRYEKKKELTKKCLKKERLIRHIVLKKRLERLKAMGELRESDRIQYEKEERLKQRLLNRPHRRSPVLVAINRKLKNAKTRRDSLGKEADGMRSKLLEMEAQLNLIKINPLREKIKQIKIGAIPEEKNNQNESLSKVHSQTTQKTNTEEVPNKLKHQDPVMKVAVKSLSKTAKGKKKLSKKISMNRSRKNSSDTGDSVDQSVRIAKRKQAIEQQNSCKALHLTKENNIANKQSKQAIVRTSTIKVKSKAKMLQKRKCTKRHKKMKTQKMNSTNNVTDLTMDKKSRPTYRPEHRKNATSIVAQENTKVKLPILLHLKHLNVNTISTMVLNPFTGQSEATDNINNDNLEQTSLESATATAVGNSMNTDKQLKQQSEQTISDEEDDESEDTDSNVPLNGIETECKILNVSKNLHRSPKDAGGDAQLVNDAQADNNSVKNNTFSSEMLRKLGAAFTESGINQQFDKSFVGKGTLKQSKPLTNLIYDRYNRHKRGDNVRKLPETIKRGLDYLNTYDKCNCNLMNTDCADASKISYIGRTSTNKVNDLNCSKHDSTELDESEMKFGKTAPQYDKTYFRRLLKEELESMETEQELQCKSDKLFKGKLYDVMCRRLNKIRQTIFSPNQNKLYYIKPPKSSTSPHQIAEFYNKVDYSNDLFNEAAPALLDIKSESHPSRILSSKKRKVVHVA